jgi:hydroxymethylglutaryl-CoA reductase (NADPH)
VLVQAQNAEKAARAARGILSHLPMLQTVVASTSRYAELIDIHPEQVGNLLFLRLSFKTGHAAGHNMSTKAADAVLEWVLNMYPDCEYVSISGNYCTDKKVSAVNGILGRGKRVIADVWISRALCETELKTTPEAIANLNLKKNYVGSTVAGSLRSANAHFSNILLAAYLAIGQDAANIVEGSQGMVHAEVQQDGLYFSVTLPNIIVGTIGNGKELDFVRKNLAKLGCVHQENDDASKKLAAIIAATVLCGELSLLAAQTNPGELMRSHLVLERQQKTKER